MKLVEQLTLVTLQTAHHGSTSPRIASTQRNHASRPVSTDFCNKIGAKRTLVNRRRVVATTQKSSKRDCGQIYGAVVHTPIACHGHSKPIAPASPWQNGFAARLIGSIRRGCVDHII